MNISQSNDTSKEKATMNKSQKTNESFGNGQKVQAILIC
jgi:hypothetical protein